MVVRTGSDRLLEHDAPARASMVRIVGPMSSCTAVIVMLPALPPSSGLRSRARDRR